MVFYFTFCVAFLPLVLRTQLTARSSHTFSHSITHHHKTHQAPKTLHERTRYHSTLLKVKTKKEYIIGSKTAPRTSSRVSKLFNPKHHDIQPPRHSQLHKWRLYVPRPHYRADVPTFLRPTFRTNNNPACSNPSFRLRIGPALNRPRTSIRSLLLPLIE
jgi:hypothetical protein